MIARFDGLNRTLHNVNLAIKINRYILTTLKRKVTAFDLTVTSALRNVDTKKYDRDFF